MPDYPGKYDNDNTQNDEIHKDKVVINQPAGNIEFVNTKDSESVTIAHKSGSSVRLDKFGTDQLTVRDKREHVMGDTLLNVNGSQTTHVDEGSQTVVLGDSKEIVGDADKWKKPMEKIKKEQRELHDMKRLFEVQRTDNHNSIDQAPKQVKAGSPVDCRTETNESTVLRTDEPMVVTMEENVQPRKAIIKIEDNVDIYERVVGAGDGRCLTCWAKMLSPSTQDGSWATEAEKQKIAAKREEIQKKIYEYEKQLGQSKCPNGGTSIRTVAKHFIENIGLVFNDFESFRKDPHGKLVPCGVKIDPFGTTIYTQYRETGLVEQVDVEKFPGGSYELNVCDGWNVTVGSNGITFKTTGPLNLYGPIVNMNGEQVSIGSKTDLNLVGERVDLVGDVITLRPNKGKRTLPTGAETEEEQQVLVDGNLNVNVNAIVRGGMHIEGEVTLHHITAPCEYQITETDFTWGNQIPPTAGGPCAAGINGIKDTSRPDGCDLDFPKSPTYATLLPGALIGYTFGVDSDGDYHCTPVYSVLSENFAQVDAHQHYFKNIPLKLIQNEGDGVVTVGEIIGEGKIKPHDTVRAIGARNNWPKPVPPQPVQNSKTENTVVNKFNGDVCVPLVIDKTDWTEKAEDDSLPDGEGVRTKKYTAEYIKAQAKAIEKEMEIKYNELKKLLAMIEEA